MKDSVISRVHDSLEDFRLFSVPPDLGRLSETKQVLQTRLPEWNPSDVEHVNERIYRKIFDRIRSKTNFLHEYQEAEITDMLYNNEFNPSMGKVKVVWESEKVKADKVEGRYYPIEREIHIARAQPSIAHTLTALGADGQFPPPIQAYMHEFTHSIQHAASNQSTLSSGAFTRGLAPTELKEAQAFRNTPIYQLFSQEKLVEKMKQYRDKTNSYSDIDNDKMEFAVGAIDTMNALGFTIQEIAGLVVSPGEWDTTALRYPKIFKSIMDRARAVGVSWFVYDIDVLKEADKLERQIDQLQAQHIVRQEVTQAAESEKVLSSAVVYIDAAISLYSQNVSA